MHTPPHYLLASLVLIPLFGSLVSYLLPRLFAKERRGVVSGLVAFIAVVLAFVAGLTLWRNLGQNEGVSAVLSPWISLGSLKLPIELYFDRLSALMTLIITGVGALIHIYSIGYMSHDRSAPRFFAYLNLFVAAMLMLALGRTLPVVFIGWEGVGLCSYLLIGFWHSNLDYASAGRKAFVMNRIGDLGFIIAMVILYQFCGTLDIRELGEMNVLRQLPPDLGLIAALAIFLAATGKSAQIPLFTWLPDAMAGPTPVSALIHAATMVTAGIYLLARMNGLIELDPLVPAVIMWVALATAALAAAVALVQNDIKKVLAYSTVSQLGFMFIAVAAGFYGVALFHVLTHAFFKACLFLSAGCVIHGCHHEQDMRKMGGLRSKMPLTAVSYAVASLAIAGIAPFSGYFSKHAIFEALSLVDNPYLVIYLPKIKIIASSVAIATAFYMARSFIMTFCGSYRGVESPHEAPMVMLVPVLVLAMLSAVAGVLLHDSFFIYLADSFPAAASLGSEGGGFIGLVLGSLPGIVGLLLAFILYVGNPEVLARIKWFFWPLERLFSAKFLVDELYEFVILKPIRGFANFLDSVVNYRFVEGVGVGVGITTSALGELVRRATTGQVATYALIMFAAVGSLVVIFVQ